jgi:hypothetical protein
MDVNFHDREIIANPFPAYEEVRSEGRVLTCRSPTAPISAWGPTWPGWKPA